MRAPRILRKPLASILKRWHICTSGGYSVSNAYGARFLLDWRHSLDKKVAVEHYEWEQVEYLKECLTAFTPEVFMDIGAHAGMYSVIIKSHFPDVTVHAYEPDQANLCQLYANLYVNGFSGSIHVHAHGISDHAGEEVFDDSEISTSRATRKLSQAATKLIQVHKLDGLFDFKERKLALKIDIEGHEIAAINGAQQLLSNNTCFLQIESFEENFGELKSRMESMGYRCIRRLHSDHYFTNSCAKVPGNEL